MAGSLERLDIEQFMKLRDSLPMIDVRSPGEYLSGHIPGAVSIPLFDDGQRAEVGTVYKNQGSMKAVMRGIDLAAPGMSSRLAAAVSLAGRREALVYCWRGGMRSGAMGWLFTLGEINSHILEGGYKAYRNHILTDLGKERNMIILGGLTGSGKTHILRHMAFVGEQVTDLEGLACHKGSAFGSLGQPPQPSTEHFANLLYDDLAPKDQGSTLWLEDESRNIGSVFMPEAFFNRMQSSPVIALMMSVETRLPRLLEEYATFPPEVLSASVMKISRRLGGDRTRTAVEAVERGDYATAIRITLEYYDRSYTYGLTKRNAGQVVYINTETDDVAVNASLVAEAAHQLRK